MTIERTPGGGICITGAGIPLYRLMSLQSMIRMELEDSRMRWRTRPALIAIAQLDPTGRPVKRLTDKVRRRALALLDEAIAAAAEANAAEQEQAE